MEGEEGGGRSFRDCYPRAGRRSKIIKIIPTVKSTSPVSSLEGGGEGLGRFS